MNIRSWGFLFGILLFSFVSSCSSSSSGSLSDKDIATFDISSSGDSITSASVDISDDGDLQVTFAPILNPNTGSPYGSDDKDKIKVSAEASKASSRNAIRSPIALGSDPTECSSSIDFGEGTASNADVAFLVDTTASMGTAVTGISNSIEEFAQALDAAELDVRLAFVTFGDAYSTKLETGSAYEYGEGADEPPAFDSYERPLLDFTSSLTEFEDFVDEIISNVGSGAGGGDGPENYYGTSAAMNGKQSSQTGLSKREGVPFYQILVGDNCSHTEESPGGSADKWIPPSKSDIGDVLGDGSVTVHVVRNSGLDGNCGDGISLSEIADATGGAKLDLGSGSVDLTEINLDEFITNFWLVDVDGGCIGDENEFVVLLTVEVTDSDSATRTQTFTITLTLE